MNEQICFVGDLFAGGTLLQRKPENLVHSPTYRDADVRVANLEHPIGTGDPIPRKSTMYAPPRAVEYLTGLELDAVSLANNHVHDLGSEGIGETIDRLDAVGIDSFGAGRTLREASEPYRVNDDLVVLGYCDYDAPSLNKIQVATRDSPGVNPLNKRSVESDLDDLESDTKAILFVHWGIENTWIPPSNVIETSEYLLAHPRVAGIIGTHPHRAQGYISRNTNRAYFSIGNFLFPNFDIEPPVSVSYESPESVPKYETKRYHPVTKRTRKTWTATARVSLLVTYETRGKTFDHVPLFQLDCDPIVHELTGKYESLTRHWLALLSRLAEGPLINNEVALLANRLLYGIWNVPGIFYVLCRQNGVEWTLKLLRVAIRAKLDPAIDANARLYEFFEN